MFTQGKVPPYSHLTAAGRGNSGIILQPLSFLHVRFIFDWGNIKVERTGLLGGGIGCFKGNEDELKGAV